MTIAVLISILKKLWGLVVDHWRIIIICLALLFVAISGYRMCGQRHVKLDEAQIEKAKQAIAVNDRKIMEEVLIESEIKEKKIDENIANAKATTVNTIAEAKKKVSQMSNEELAAELERKMNQ